MYARAPEEQGLATAHGRKLVDEHTAFPRTRRYRDLPFALLFVFVLAFVTYYGARQLSQLSGQAHLSPEDTHDIKIVANCVGIGAGGAFLASFVLILLLRAMPLQIVWFCLLLPPTLWFCLAAGVAYAHSQNADDVPILPAVIFGAFGCINLLYVCCLRKYIPLTAMMMRTVSHVLLHKMNVVLVAFLCALLQQVWNVLCFAAIISFNVDGDTGGLPAGTQWAFYLVAIWGMLVFRNIGYFCYCSVFGQWYHDKRVTVAGSFCTAITTSLGSICFGSLVVAVVRLLEAMAKNCRRSNNAVTKVIGWVLGCLLACIADILEWFASIAYVQCAVRGVGFCDGARATMALATQANLDKLIGGLLSQTVTGMGAFIAGLSGVACTLLYLNTSVDKHTNVGMTWGLGLGLTFFDCFFIGYTMFCIVQAGVNTIMVCWAEESTRLATVHPEIHNQFQAITGAPLQRQGGMEAYA